MTKKVAPSSEYEYHIFKVDLSPSSDLLYIVEVDYHLTDVAGCSVTWH